MKIEIQKLSNKRLLVKVDKEDMKNKVTNVLDAIGTELDGYNYVSNSVLIDEITTRIVVDYIKNNHNDMLKDNDAVFVDIVIGDKTLNIIISKLVDVSPEINGIEYGQILGDNIKA